MYGCLARRDIVGGRTSYSALLVLFQASLVSVMDTKSVEGEMSDGRSRRVSDTEGSGDCGCGEGGCGESGCGECGGGDGGGGVSGVGQCDGIVADASVVFADAGEGGVDGLGVRRHGRVTVKGAEGALVRSADGGGVHGYGGSSVTVGWCGRVAHGWGSNDAGVGAGQQSAQDDKLQTIQCEVRTFRSVLWSHHELAQIVRSGLEHAHSCPLDSYCPT